jgi:hypothetical protein
MKAGRQALPSMSRLGGYENGGPSIVDVDAPSETGNSRLVGDVLEDERRHGAAECSTGL